MTMPFFLAYKNIYIYIYSHGVESTPANGAPLPILMQEKSLYLNTVNHIEVTDTFQPLKARLSLTLCWPLWRVCAC